MTITVTGQTFPHRELFKSWNGKFDGDRKAWVFHNLLISQFETLRKMVGVLVTDDLAPSKPEPDAPRISVRQNLDSIIARLLSDDDEPITRRNRADPLIIGDDQRYLNHFADQNPTAFFGFSSLHRFTQYVATLTKPAPGKRNEGWGARPEWHGTPDMAAALDLARNGWQEGLQDQPELVIPHATAKRRLHSVAGGSVNVGRMLSGDPAHMIRRPKQPGRRVMTLFVETFMSSGIDTDNAIIRAKLVAAMADRLEQQGYSCEIVAIVTTLGITDGVGHQCAITLKHAGETLNLLDIVFALGHPSFFRRMIFATVSACDACSTTWATQGMPTAAFNRLHPCGRNEFYVRQLSLASQRKITDDPLSMLPFIKPDGLEL